MHLWPVTAKGTLGPLPYVTGLVCILFTHKYGSLFKSGGSGMLSILLVSSFDLAKSWHTRPELFKFISSSSIDYWLVENFVNQTQNAQVQNPTEIDKLCSNLLYLSPPHKIRCWYIHFFKPIFDIITMVTVKTVNNLLFLTILPWDRIRRNGLMRSCYLDPPCLHMEQILKRDTSPLNWNHPGNFLPTTSRFL